MNRKWLWLAVFGVLAGSMLVTLLAQAGQGEPRAQWEYRAVVISGPFSMADGTAEIEAKINAEDGATFMRKNGAWGRGALIWR